MTEPTLYPESGFRRLRLDISYDGTNFSGWAIQPDRRTVQQSVEDAIRIVSQAKAETIVAGRTDAGVHATGQVIHVDVPESLELDDLAYKLNRILDEDIRVNKIQIAPPAFHARFSARGKQYRYRVWNHPAHHPLWRQQAWHVTRPLDLAAIRAAADLGGDDFIAPLLQQSASKDFNVRNAAIEAKRRNNRSASAAVPLVGATSSNNTRCEAGGHCVSMSGPVTSSH